MEHVGWQMGHSGWKGVDGFHFRHAHFEGPEGKVNRQLKHQFGVRGRTEGGYISLKYSI